MVATSEQSANLACSFCGKSQDDVHKLIAGPATVHICDMCIDLCNDIIAEETGIRRHLGFRWPTLRGSIPLLYAFFFGALLTYFFMR